MELFEKKECMHEKFREENGKVKKTFHRAKKTSMEPLPLKLVFDEEKNLLCITENFCTTIFRGTDIDRFEITEDTAPLFEGSAYGLRQYPSFVPDRAVALASLVDRARRQNDFVPLQCIPGPLEKFHIRIYMVNQPCCTVITHEINGPVFNTSLGIDHYLSAYKARVNELTDLARQFTAFIEASAKDAMAGHAE